jgi:hypothetical protein
MYKKHQRGALSLLWAAVFVGIVTLAAMVALMSARYERNYFAEAWRRVTGSDVGRTLQKTQQSMTTTVKSDTAGVRKCIVEGKPVYSNVDCASENPTSRRVELYDTKGFEAPKPPPPAATDAPVNMRDRMIEKATQQ